MAVPPQELTPNPTIQELVFTLLRAGLQIAGTVGITLPAWANISALWSMAGAIALIVGVALTIWSKFQAARKLHNSAVESARTGTPTITTSTGAAS